MVQLDLVVNMFGWPNLKRVNRFCYANNKYSDDDVCKTECPWI